MNKRALLFLLPVAVLILSIIVVMERNPYYSCWSDPPYCYLFNGLNIASGHFQVGQVDHPGTPLQLFTGGAIRFFYLFSNDKDVVHDVLSRPEWYLFRIGILQSIIAALCMYCAGLLMFRFTRSVFYSLMVQLTLICSFHALFFSQNLMTEFILATTGILLAPFLVQYTFDDKSTGRKRIVPVAIISGIMLAGKISSFPVFLLWLFIIKSRKQLLVFISASVASFLLFTIPAWHAAKEFFGFMTNISTHTGKYGGGRKGMVIWTEFFEHLKILFTDSYLFTITFIMLTIIVVNACIKFLQKQQSNTAVADKTLLAIWLITLMQLFIVSKHFAQHYMVPVHLLIVPAWIILFISRWPYVAEKKFSPLLVILFAAIILVKSTYQYNFFPGLEQPGKQLANITEKKKYDLALFDCNVTAPFPQVALLFGVGYSGLCASIYNQYLQQIYPPFYWLNRGNNMFRNFKGEYEPIKVLPDSIPVLYYSDNPDFIINNLQWDGGRMRVDSVLFKYKHPLSGESVFIVTLKKN